MLILVCICIFLFSNQPGVESTKLASNLFVRKLGHFSEYAILGFFAFAYFSNIFQIEREKIRLETSFFISFLFCFSYAVSDEFHQTFVIGRDGNFMDVLIDSGGVLFGIIISIILFSVKILKKK
ncbi:VanZ family protein [Gemella morbillorum]|uniref:VanZ family protein n=1 Tax=Gemella morbillorum TaxID=29391 RepID=UPI0028D81F6F|nr:VanZ family protein [Gemella morbillorum]